MDERLCCDEGGCLGGCQRGAAGCEHKEEKGHRTPAKEGRRAQREREREREMKKEGRRKER